MAVLICASLVHASPRRDFIDSLQNNFIIEWCGKGPIRPQSLAECAKNNPDYTPARRLISLLAWMDSIGRITNDKMAEALSDRYDMYKMLLTANPTAVINNEGWPLSGDPKSPLTITMYFSTTCPLCKTSYRDLHNAVTTGPLKGKAKLVSKPFVITPQNTALTAAHELNRFHDFMIALGQRGGRVDDNLINAIVDSLKIDKKRFNALLEDPKLAKRLEESTQEGRNNGVSLVPTMFISGFRYNHFLDSRWVVDAVEFMHESRK